MFALIFIIINWSQQPVYAKNDLIIILMNKNNQLDQFPIRDDVIQFSFDVVKSARNRYRRKNITNNQNQSTQLPSRTDSNDKLRQQLKNYVEKGLTNDNRQISVDRVFSKGEKAKRASFTSRNTSRYQIENAASMKMAKTQSMQVQKLNFNKITPVSFEKIVTSSTPIQSQQDFFKNSSHEEELKSSFGNAQSSYRRLQLKYSKVGIRDIGIQSWLNEALLEATPNIVIDKKAQNSGLIFYSIDRSSLLRKGIHPQHISRLYRSFFVYSLGFNNLLKTLCNKNQDLQKCIWKVFALLLQYCSGGTFQTMIGAIQRDKQAKILQLKAEIEQRQKLIEKNDEKNQKNNGKILKEVRELQKKTKNLQQERQVILQDFHQAEQSFNQQIALRLKYQTKINQIHGVYEELRQKNSSLKQQFNKNLQTISGQAKKIQVYKSEMTEMSAEISSQKLKISNLQASMALLYQSLNETQNISKVSGINLVSAKNHTQNLMHVLAQKNRKIEQLQLTIVNMKSSENSLMLTLKEQAQQVEKAMKENSNLHKHIGENCQDINRLTQEKRQLGHKTTQIISMLNIQSKKIAEKQQTILSLKKENQQIRQNLDQKILELETQQAKSAALEKDLQSCHLNIKQMKQKQNELSTMLSQAENKIVLLNQTILAKQTEEGKYISKIQQLKTQIHGIKMQIKHKQSLVIINEQKLKSQNQLWESKMAITSKQLENFKIKCQKYQKQRESMLNQIETNKQKYQKVYIDFKNEKFERNNLNLYYQQSLSVMQQQIQHIKKLNIQISEMSQQIEQGKRKYATLQLIHKHRTQLLEKDLLFWKNSYTSLQKKSKQREMYVHPMLYEDQCETIRNLKLGRLRAEGVVRGLENKIEGLKQEITRLSKQGRIVEEKAIQDKQVYFRKQLLKRQQEIKFLKQKLAYESSKLKQIEGSLQKSIKEKDAALQQSIKVESQLMKKMNQKNLQLTQLNQKYRSILSLNQNQLKQNEKMTNKWEAEKRQLQHKLQQLTHKSIMNENLNRKQLKHSELKSKKQQKVVKNDKHNGKPIHTNRSLQGNGDANEQQLKQQDELQHLQSKQQIKQKQQPGADQAGPMIQKQSSQEMLRKREDIKKKIKGAYLYYLK